VWVKGGAHYSGMAVGQVAELGLCHESARIEFNFRHDDVRTEDYGQEVPADLRYQMATARLSLTLLHYDPIVLEVLQQEALGGRTLRPPGPAGAPDWIGFAGGFGRPGTLMGGRKAMYASGNRFVAVSIVPAGRADPEQQDTPYRFRKCVLSEMPLRLSLGAECSLAQLTFRCLPYCDPTEDGSAVKRAEHFYSGTVLWDYADDALNDGARF
jgi:hypothetical protein